MYERFYGLQERPFDLSPNPRFLCFTPQHREALAHLEYGLAGRPGVTVLIGMLPAARVSDMCVCVGPPDVIVMGSPTVLTMNMPQARIMDPTAHGGMLVKTTGLAA